MTTDAPLPADLEVRLIKAADGTYGHFCDDLFFEAAHEIQRLRETERQWDMLSLVALSEENKRLLATCREWKDQCDAHQTVIRDLERQLTEARSRPAPDVSDSPSTGEKNV